MLKVTCLTANKFGKSNQQISKVKPTNLESQTNKSQKSNRQIWQVKPTNPPCQTNSQSVREVRAGSKDQNSKCRTFLCVKFWRKKKYLRWTYHLWRFHYHWRWHQLSKLNIWVQLLLSDFESHMLLCYLPNLLKLGCLDFKLNWKMLCYLPFDELLYWFVWIYLNLVV